MIDDDAVALNRMVLVDTLDTHSEACRCHTFMLHLEGPPQIGFSTTRACALLLPDTLWTETRWDSHTALLEARRLLP